IVAGNFVPIYIRSDGAFEFEIHVGRIDAPAALTPREQRYLTVQSAPYLFRSQGEACLSGIEYVNGEIANAVGRFPLAAGDYAVCVHLIAWDDEPGMRDERGQPHTESLPDFIVLLNPAKPGIAFRDEVATFDQQE